MKRLVFLCLLLALACAAGCNGGAEVTWDAPTDYARRINPSGQTVILVIDRSLSMRSTDPRNFNIAGSQIALSILDDDDNVGVVTFAEDAEALVPTRSLKTHAIRTEFREKLDSVQMTGMATDFTKGLGLAKAYLDPLKLPKDRVSVVFLTDGSHSILETKEDIPPLIDTFAKKGWKIYSIAFGAKIAEAGGKGLLQEMATKTKGAYFKIEKPRDLPGAFVQIFSHIKDFMTYKGKGDLVVLPLLKRLLYLMIKRRPKDQFRQILRDRRAIDLEAEKVFHYPPGLVSSGRISRFEVVSFSKPKIGSYACKYRKGPEVWKLATFPLKAALASGSPPSQVVEGDAFDVVLNVTCETDEVAAEVRKTGSTQAAFFLPGSEKPAVEITCLPVEGKSRIVTFKGTTYLALPKKGQAESFELKATFGLVDTSGGAWEVQKLSSVKVVPGPPPLLQISPPQANFGRRWDDEGPLELSLSMATEVTGAVEVAIENSSDLVVLSAAKASLTKGQSSPLVVSLDLEKILAAGRRKAALNLVFNAKGAGRSKRITVPVIFDLYTFEGPKEIEFDHVPPGYQISKNVDIKITPPVHPLSARESSVSCGDVSIPIIAMLDKVKEGEETAPPADGSGETPEDGSGETPEDGSGETPEDGSGKTPEDGSGETPEDGSGKTPEDGSGETPEDGSGKTPEDGSGETPADDGVLIGPDETGKHLDHVINFVRRASNRNIVGGRTAEGVLLSKAEDLTIDGDELRALDERRKAGEIDAVEFLRLSAQAAGCAIEVLDEGVYRVYRPPAIRMEDFSPERTPEQISEARARVSKELSNASLPRIEADSDPRLDSHPIDVTFEEKTLEAAASVLAERAGIALRVAPGAEEAAGRALTLKLTNVEWALVLEIVAEQTQCRIRRNQGDVYEFYLPAETDKDETGDKEGSTAASEEGAPKKDESAPTAEDSVDEATAGDGDGKEGEAKPEEAAGQQYRISLSIPTTEDTPEGFYTGKLVITGGSNPPLTREIPLKAPISLPAPKIALKAEKIEGKPDTGGYVTRELTLQLKTPFETDCVLETSDLRPAEGAGGMVSNTFDIRLTPRDGWDGRLIEPGKEYKLKYRAFFSSDLGTGVYKGFVLFRMKSRGKESLQKVPVTVEVRGGQRPLPPPSGRRDAEPLPGWIS